MKIADEVLRPFGETEDGTKVDDLGCHCAMIRKLLCKQTQISVTKLSHGIYFTNFGAKVLKNLHISKKCSIFAPNFIKINR